MPGKRALVPLLTIMTVLLVLSPHPGGRVALAEVQPALLGERGNAVILGDRETGPLSRAAIVVVTDTTAASSKQSETPTPESEVSLPDLLRPVLSPSATPEATSVSTPEIATDQGIAETPVAEASPSISPGDAERFTALLATQAGAETLAGPFNAILKETEGSISLSWANLSVADFHASAVVDVPSQRSDVPWDAGFLFRQSADGTFRIAISSDGNWYFSVGSGPTTASGPIPSLATDAGASNTIDLMAEGETGWLGVNGELVGVVNLPANGEAADLALGTGFYANEVVTDRVTGFHDFIVRSLAPGSLGAGGGTGSAEEDAKAFQTVIDELDTATPVAGPFSGRLVEATTGVVPVAPAGVAVSDFATSATFVNPDTGSDALWDFGFQFRDNESERNRVVIDARGDIYTTLAGQQPAQAGHADGFDTTPGAINTLQLVVEGDRAYLGVNGQFATAIALPAEPLSSDVVVGAGFFTEDFLIGRVSDYKDFRVWELTSP